MIKRILCMTLIIICMLSLSACGCKHQWEDATCTVPKTCALCGETDGDAAAHTWEEATYTAPKTCVSCGQTEGKPLEKLNEGFESSQIYEAVVSTFVGSMGNYDPEFEYDEAAQVLRISMTAPEGLAAGFEDSSDQLREAWEKVVENLTKMSGMFKEGFEVNGYTVSCEITLKSDENSAEIFLNVRDGETVFNAMDELR